MKSMLDVRPVMCEEKHSVKYYFWVLEISFLISLYICHIMQKACKYYLIVCIYET